MPHSTTADTQACTLLKKCFALLSKKHCCALKLHIYENGAACILNNDNEIAIVNSNYHCFGSTSEMLSRLLEPGSDILVWSIGHVYFSHELGTSVDEVKISLDLST